MKFIIQVVSRLPPSNGLGDYALNLARQLHKDFGIAIRSIIGALSWLGSKEVEGFLVSQVTTSSPTELISPLPSDDNSQTLPYGYRLKKLGRGEWYART